MVQSLICPLFLTLEDRVFYYLEQMIHISGTFQLQRLDAAKAGWP